ncbi:MAG: hypothetical protein KC586_28480, partial [Myxococcales bacterium]|nr:hypothetical protein [Myxococcales bacterium]
MLESVVGGEKQARYSFVGFDPFVVVRGGGDWLEVREGAVLRTREGVEPFEELARVLWSDLRTPPASALPESEPPTAAPLLDPLAPKSPEEFEDVPLRPSTPAQAKAEASQRLSMPPGEVEELLDVSDFFLAQGLIDEARMMLQDALSAHPGHPLINDKLREVEFAAQAAAQSRASQDLDVDQSFELAEKLAEEFDEVDDTQAGRDVLDVEQVFAQFKKGVEE